MPCHHALEALLARTHFAADALRVHRAQLARDRRRRAALARAPQNGARAATTVLSAAPAPQLHADELLCVRDDGSRLRVFKDAKLLRHYADYDHTHGAVWDAVLYFLGSRAFSDDAQPSDALALVVAAALVLAVCEATEMTGKMLPETRKKAAVMANVVIPFNQGTVYACKTNLAASAQLKNQLLIAHGMIVGSADTKSSFVTDMLWCLCTEVSFLVMFSSCPDIESTATDEFMKFAAVATGVDLVSAPPALLTAQGLIQYCGNTYKVAGYCQDGVMLGLVHKGVHAGILSLAITECLFKVLGYHNIKGPEDVCGGCRAATVKKNGYLWEFTNPLICADLKSGGDFVVKKDGSLSFSAETLLYDKKKGKAIRTTRKALICEAYDMHSLLGFNPETCPNLSSLFRTGTPGQIIVAASEGICVSSTLQRVDSYELDESGRVISITHGGITKRAEITTVGRSWGVRGGTSFYFEDVVG